MDLFEIVWMEVSAVARTIIAGFLAWCDVLAVGDVEISQVILFMGCRSGRC